MNEESYLNERLEDQIKWYNKKSAANKKWFRICQIIQIVVAAIITVSGIFTPEEFPWVYYAIPVLGAIIAITSGILGLYKFQENWLEYRRTAESLLQEKYLFLTKSDPYNMVNALNLLVNRTESLISNENSNWSQNMQKMSNEDV